MLEKGFSIIICTYNGGERIETTLSYIAALKIPVNFAVEVILVNNNSIDNTEHLAKETWLKLGSKFPLQLVNEERRGKGYAIETGYDKANNSYILTVDDDNWLSNDYLFNTIELIESDSEIGILQSKSEGIFEVVPPDWVHNFLPYFIIGSPLSHTGYFPKNNCWVWGAGMVIKKSDWVYLRSIGFSFLTSKLPGKAAGEDNELAIALLMLGRKIYYSEKLTYKHYMPKERIDWEKLKQNFDTYGFVLYYIFLYILVSDSYRNGYSINKKVIRNFFLKFWLGRSRSYNLKLHLGYFFLNKKMHYQLFLKQNYSMLKWYLKLSKNAVADIKFLQSWMVPLLIQKPDEFILPIK